MIFELNITNPFVGLRPFQEDDSLLFFGRKFQVTDLLQKLYEERFLAVVGGSGSGKSSLVKAGLIPKLKAGFLVSDRDSWYIASMRPGNSPIYNFAEALIDAVDDNARGKVKELDEAISESGIYAVVDYLTPYLENTRYNFLLIVDQFEEIFRYKSQIRGRKDKSKEFVSLMIELSRLNLLPIYVVQTMRSDFIGECDVFNGLPEALNRSQYLVPRLNRQQRKEVIEAPPRLFGKNVASRLTDRLLNDIGDEQDQLPILQHTLMRIWDCAEKHGSMVMDLDHYEEIGTSKSALSNHADEVYNELSTPEEKLIAEIMFKRLTEKLDEHRGVRRPCPLDEIAGVSGCSTKEVIEIVEIFRKEHRSFLTPPVGMALDKDSMIDISHESLMRNWERLIGWIDDEVKAASQYLSLSGNASLNEKGKANLLGELGVKTFTEWREETQHNAIWASRYDENYEMAILYLDRSIKAYEENKKEERRRKRQKITLRILSIVLPLITLLTIYAFLQRNEAKQQTKLAEKQKFIADSAATEAVYQKNIADSTAYEALLQKRFADSNAAEALYQKNIADSMADKAMKARHIAQENEKRAIEAGELARRNEEEIRAQYLKIQEQLEEINLQRDTIAAKSQQSQSNALAAAAFQQMANNPTLSFRLAEYAYKIDNKNARAQQALVESFYKGLNNLNRFSEFSRNGNLLATMLPNEEGPILIWNLQEGTKTVLDIQASDVIGMYFSPSSKFLVIIKDLSRQEEFMLFLFLFSEKKSVFQGQIKPFSGEFWLYGEPNSNYFGEFNYYGEIIFAPDDQMAIILGRGNQMNVLFFNFEKGFEFQSQKLQSGGTLASAAFFTDNSEMATLSDEGTIQLWDLRKSYIKEKFKRANKEQVIDYSNKGQVATIEFPAQISRSIQQQKAPEQLNSVSLFLWNDRKPTYYDLSNTKMSSYTDKLQKYPVPGIAYAIKDPAKILDLVNEVKVFGEVKQFSNEELNAYIEEEAEY